MNSMCADVFSKDQIVSAVRTQLVLGYYLQFPNCHTLCDELSCSQIAGKMNGRRGWEMTKLQTFEKRYTPCSELEGPHFRVLMKGRSR